MQVVPSQLLRLASRCCERRQGSPQGRAWAQALSVAPAAVSRAAAAAPAGPAAAAACLKHHGTGACFGGVQELRLHTVAAAAAWAPLALVQLLRQQPR